MYKVRYHKLVLKEDFKGIQKGDQLKIVKAIKKKLARGPEELGKPLTGDLKGYCRLRVDVYRVVYRISKGRVEVLVIKVGLRKDMKAYIQAAKRLGLLK